VKPCTPGDLIDLALERARYEYTELADNWKLLDTKAQATAAIAGVFLAAFFTFVYRDSDGAAGCGLPAVIHWKVLPALLLVCLLAAIVCSLWAMWVTEVDMPPSGEWTWDAVKELLTPTATADSLGRGMRRIKRDFVEDWLKANRVLEKYGQTKAAGVMWAQRALLAGAVLGTVLPIWHLFTAHAV